MGTIDPLVSIIVPVYNRENLLQRCLDTLVYQTLNEIEIIIIDDGSTDQSLNVCEYYREKFQDKVFLYSNPNKGVANAKNYGISKAHGEYITFVDSDDYVEYWAFETLYNIAIEGRYNIVSTPIKRRQGLNWSIWGEGLVGLNSEDIMKSDFHWQFGFLCTKLFHRSVFEKYGNIPDLSRGEDIAFLYTILSYEESLIFVNKPYYYYELSENSICNVKDDIKYITDMFKCVDIVLQKSNPKYHDIIIWMLFRRIVTSMHEYWKFKDIIIKYILDNFHLISNNSFIKEEKIDTFNQLMGIKLYANVPISRKVFIDAFNSKKPTSERVLRIQQKAFREGAEVIILDESNCDISSNEIVKEAYKKEKYEFVGKYFAIKKIYEEGGVYLSNSIEIEESLNYLSYDPAFFGYINRTDFTDDIFGGIKGNSVFKEILNTYAMPEIYENLFEPLASRIKTILLVKCGVRLTGTNQFDALKYGAMIYSPSLFVLKFENDINICTHKISDFVGEENCVTVLEKTLDTLVINRVNVAARNKNMIIQRQKNRIAYLTEWNNRRIEYISSIQEIAQKRSNYIVEIENENKKLKKELDNLKNSSSWKITAPLRKIMNRLRTIF